VSFDQTVLVVGAGSIGRRHLANLRKLCPASRIVVLCRPESADDTLLTLGADHVVASLAAALDERPHIAVIANPAPLHVSVAQQMADIGCHLLVEKPFSDRIDGVDRLIDTCDAKGLVLMVGYNLRFFPSLQEMASLIANDAVGRVLHVSAEVAQYLPDWRPNSDYRQGVTAQSKLGGGALLELSHEIDIALWMGGAIVEVAASLDRVGDLEIDTDDCVDLLLKFESGARGSIHMDLLQRVPVRRCRVVGTTGTLEWDGIADRLRCGLSSEGFVDVATRRLADRNDMYINEVAHFLFCVANGLKPVTDGQAAKRVLMTIVAARASAASGCMPMRNQ